MANLLEGLITREGIAGIAESENLILDDEDRISVLESMGSIDVQACPGSGKTTLIAAKLILLAKKWPLQNQGICVLSHTNVAKDEIIERLEKSQTVEAQNLLSYPHFIGTIQEFTNRFLALPYLRSKGIRDITVDNDEYVKIANKLLELDQFIWFRGTLNGLGSQENKNGFLRGTHRFVSEGGLDIQINKKPRAWAQPANLLRAQNSLGQLKQYLDERGFYLYRDMYTHADIIASHNGKLSQSIVKRFPYVFLDEMQDTQKFQDELLLQIFSPDETGLIVQRFGDPDQGIFHGINGEKPNVSFNSKATADMDFVINKSHRFDNGIAEKIRRFSFNEVALETELSDASLEERSHFHSEGQAFGHTIITYDDDQIKNVIPEFAQIVSLQFSDSHKQSNDFSVKVIGAVGNEIDPQRDELKIGHFWSDFDKVKSRKSFKEETLIEAVYYCRQTISDDWASSYKLLIDCVLKLLRAVDKKDTDGKYFSATSMKESLKARDEWKNFREIIHIMLNEAYLIDQEFWDDAKVVLLTAIDINPVPAELNEYLAFHELEIIAAVADNDDEPEAGSLASLPENMIQHTDGFKIELSTIHGVKGETHDATLVLETKNHCFDLETMMPYLTENLPSDGHPNADLRENPHSRAAFKPNQRFMRQLYVATSRPKHLLCLAVHNDRIDNEQRDKLIEKGWSIQQVHV